MKASDAKPFIGQMVEYVKKGWPRPRHGVVSGVAGRNIILEDDALWAPDIISMKPVSEDEDQP